MRTKVCATCKESKPLKAFGRNRQSPDGLHYYCKTCAALRQRAWASSNPAKVKAAKQRYLGKVRATNVLRGDPYA